MKHSGDRRHPLHWNRKTKCTSITWKTFRSVIVKIANALITFVIVKHFHPRNHGDTVIQLSVKGIQKIDALFL